MSGAKNHNRDLPPASTNWIDPSIASTAVKPGLVDTEYVNDDGDDAPASTRSSSSRVFATAYRKSTPGRAPANVSVEPVTTPIPYAPSNEKLTEYRPLLTVTGAKLRALRKRHMERVRRIRKPRSAGISRSDKRVVVTLPIPARVQVIHWLRIHMRVKGAVLTNKRPRLSRPQRRHRRPHRRLRRRRRIRTRQPITRRNHPNDDQQQRTDDEIPPPLPETHTRPRGTLRHQWLP